MYIKCTCIYIYIYHVCIYIMLCVYIYIYIMYKHTHTSVMLTPSPRYRGRGLHQIWTDGMNGEIHQQWCKTKKTLQIPPRCCFLKFPILYFWPYEPGDMELWGPPAGPLCFPGCSNGSHLHVTFDYNSVYMHITIYHHTVDGWEILHQLIDGLSHFL